MRKSNIWWLVLIILIVAVALFVALNIDHPAWAENLLFWQPAGQRDIALRQGLDLQGGLQITLVANTSEGQEPNSETMEAARRVLENRARALEVGDSVVKLQGNTRVVVQLPGIRERRRVTETYQAIGLVEFVGAGYQDAGTLIGTLVETSLGGPPTPVEETEPLIPTIPLSPTAEADTASQVLETALSSDGLTYIAPRRTGENEYTIDFALKSEAVDGFTYYTSAHAGQFLCVTLDKLVLSCATLPNTPLEGGGGIPARLVDAEVPAIAAVLSNGQLPIPLLVEEIKPIPPSLGEVAIQRGGRVIFISLVAIWLFLSFSYRLPGLLVDLALAIFALIMFALCKVVPLPFTVPSIVGFAAAGLLATGSQLFIVERLREEMRTGLLTPKTIDGCFSRHRQSIRDTHIALLILAIAAWYTGTAISADAVRWLGTALTSGTLISFFVTMVVARTFSHLVFDQAQGWPDERRWLLGI